MSTFCIKALCPDILDDFSFLTISLQVSSISLLSRLHIFPKWHTLQIAVMVTVSRLSVFPTAPGIRTLTLPLSRHVGISTLLFTCNSRSFLTFQVPWLLPAEPAEKMSMGRESIAYLPTALGRGSRKPVNCPKTQFRHIWNEHKKYLAGKFWRWNKITYRKMQASSIKHHS